MKARIVHLLSSFGMGGQERVAFDLATSQLRAGCWVAALSMAPPPDGPLAAEFRAAGALVDRVARPRPGVDPLLIPRIARWLLQHDVELVHTHNRFALIYGAPAARLAGARVVHTKHGNNPRGGKRLVAGNLAGRLVHAFVAVSPETAEFARKRREADERRLLVIPNGIELGRFHPAPAGRDRVRRELGIDADAWVIGTVGRIAPEKNQALLVQAMAPLLGPKVRLVIAGDGPLLTALTERVGSLGVAGSVHLLGGAQGRPRHPQRARHLRAVVGHRGAPAGGARGDGDRPAGDLDRGRRRAERDRRRPDRLPGAQGGRASVARPGGRAARRPRREPRHGPARPVGRGHAVLGRADAARLSGPVRPRAGARTVVP